MSFRARAVIRLGAMRHNLNVIRNAAPGAKVMAVIKANAYGHGLLTAAKALAEADAYAVAVNVQFSRHADRLARVADPLEATVATAARLPTPQSAHIKLAVVLKTQIARSHVRTVI